jgi:hypothetical protein
MLGDKEVFEHEAEIYNDEKIEKEVLAEVEEYDQAFESMTSYVVCSTCKT